MIDRCFKPDCKQKLEYLRKNAGVQGRWHDNRHTLITELAESGAGDQTIMDIAGHVSKQMLRHYSHIRMVAKRNALETIVRKRSETSTTEDAELECSASSVTTQDFEGGYPQKSPQLGVFEGHRAVYRNRKSLKRIGSSGRTRTYNPSVNSRMTVVECHLLSLGKRLRFSLSRQCELHSHMTLVGLQEVQNVVQSASNKFNL